MTREQDLPDSRRGLLKDEYTERPSLDEDCSGSDLGLDELEILEAEPSSPRIRGGWSPIKRKKKGIPQGNPSKRIGGLFRHKICFLIGAVLLGGLVGVLGGIYSGFFKKPGLQDGVSNPLHSPCTETYGA